MNRRAFIRAARIAGAAVAACGAGTLVAAGEREPTHLAMCKTSKQANVLAMDMGASFWTVVIECSTFPENQYGIVKIWVTA